MCFCLKLFLQLFTKVASIEAVGPLDFLWDASWRPFRETGGLGSFLSLREAPAQCSAGPWSSRYHFFLALAPPRPKVIVTSGGAPHMLV